MSNDGEEVMRRLSGRLSAMVGRRQARSSSRRDGEKIRADLQALVHSLERQLEEQPAQFAAHLESLKQKSAEAAAQERPAVAYSSQQLAACCNTIKGLRNELRRLEGQRIRLAQQLGEVDSHEEEKAERWDLVEMLTSHMVDSINKLANEQQLVRGECIRMKELMQNLPHCSHQLQASIHALQQDNHQLAELAAQQALLAQIESSNPRPAAAASWTAGRSGKEMFRLRQEIVRQEQDTAAMTGLKFAIGQFMESVSQRNQDTMETEHLSDIVADWEREKLELAACLKAEKKEMQNSSAMLEKEIKEIEARINRLKEVDEPFFIVSSILEDLLRHATSPRCRN